MGGHAVGREVNAPATELAGLAAAAAEQAARTSYGRLLSWLAWQWRDIAAAEDALAEAFATALARWPVDGVPSSPDSWLLTTAKRTLLMQARREKLRKTRPCWRCFRPKAKVVANTRLKPQHFPTTA